MDEPASALDPIATGRIEELILELKKYYTIVIVTHNMGQASRVSDHTAFFMVDEGGRAIWKSMLPPSNCSSTRHTKKDGRVHLRKIRLILGGNHGPNYQ